MFVMTQICIQMDTMMTKLADILDKIFVINKEDKKYMFDYDKTLDVLRDFKKMNPKKRRKIMTALFYDDTFMEWLFQPKPVPNLTEMVSDMYSEFTKPIVMMAMIDAVKEEGYSEFTRSHATFMFSVANIAIQTNNEMIEEITEKKKDGEYSAKECRRLIEKIDDSNEIISKLLKVSRKIIKRDATIISRESRLPKYIGMSALTSIPESKYIDNFKVPVYMNTLTNTIYSEVNRNGEFDKGVKWKVFFKEVFGKDNIAEVATYILLEGVHRIDKYENSSDVKDCWNSLTSFALKELDSIPTSLRNQMVELYIKKIDKMFKNNTIDLRVDMLNLDENIFPNLAKTIDKYADKIVAILDNKDK